MKVKTLYIKDSEMTNFNFPFVSIITVNWNNNDDTSEMLESLRRISYPNYEVIVVDNYSTSCDATNLKMKFPEIKLVLSGKNLGFAGGNNLGLKYASGEYILLLNNDTVVDKNFLEPLVRLMETDHKIGIVSPKIYFYDEPNKLQYAGTSAINEITTRGKKFGYGSIDSGQFNTIKETGFSNGACMLVRQSLINRVGFLRTEYFLYYEETDFCLRAKENGYKVFFNPESKIYHKISSSTGKNSPLQTYYQNRNRVLFIRLNFRGMKKFVAIVYYLMIAFPKSIMKNLLYVRINHLKALFNAILWNLKDSGLSIISNL